MFSSRARNGFWALLVLLAGCALSYGLLVGKPRPESREQAPPPLPRVDVMVAAPATRGLSVQTQGTVEPLREIKLVARVGGRVEAVAPGFAEGGFFRAGASLVKIEDIDYRLALARARSQVAAARQRVAEEQGRALQAGREWRDLGSEQANALFLRKPQLAAAEAALGAARADLTAAELDLERTEILAPFDGRIREKLVDAGQYVTAGTPVATVYDTGTVQVRLPLTDRQLALLELPLSYDNVSEEVRPGPAVVLRARFAGRVWEWQGEVVRTDASIDVDSRVLYAVAEVDEPFARLPGSARPPLAPGLFVDATIAGRPIPDLTRLPRSALRGEDTVMTVDGEQRVRERTVRVLQSNPQEVWVQGLAPGERVIVREPSTVVAGMAVSVNDLGEFAGGEA